MKSIRPAIAASILTIFAFAPSSLASTARILRGTETAAPSGISLEPLMVLARANADGTSSTLAPENKKDTDTDAINPDNAGDNASIDPDSENESEQAQDGDSDKTDQDQTASDDEKDGDGPDSDDSDSTATTAANGGSEESTDTAAAR